VKVRVRFFAQQREEVGHSELEMEVAEGTTVADLVSALGRDYPAVEAASRYLVPAVNTEYVDLATVLRPGDEVALIPPVSGGLC